MNSGINTCALLIGSKFQSAQPSTTTWGQNQPGVAMSLDGKLWRLAVGIRGSYIVNISPYIVCGKGISLYIVCVSSVYRRISSVYRLYIVCISFVYRPISSNIIVYRHISFVYRHISFAATICGVRLRPTIYNDVDMKSYDQIPTTSLHQ